MNTFTIRPLTFDLHGTAAAQGRGAVRRDVTSFTRIDDASSLAEPLHLGQYADRDRPFHALCRTIHGCARSTVTARFDVPPNATTLPWFAGPAHVLQEPVFAPRSPDAPEGDGYCSAQPTTWPRCAPTGHPGRHGQTELARVILPFRNAYQVHGLWATPRDLPLA